MLGCGGPPPPAPPPVVSELGPGLVPGFGAGPEVEATRGWARVVSRRFHVSVPVPDGRGWHVDDHSRPELLAEHTGSASRMTLQVTHESQLTSRGLCEERGRALGVVPRGNLKTVEDEVLRMATDFDARVWTAVQPGLTEEAPVTGFVFAFAGYLRKCLLFRYETQVPSGRADGALSERLALVRSRMLPALQVEGIGTLPRERARDGGRDPGRERFSPPRRTPAPAAQ